MNAALTPSAQQTNSGALSNKQSDPTTNLTILGESRKSLLVLRDRLIVLHARLSGSQMDNSESPSRAGHVGVALDIYDETCTLHSLVSLIEQVVG